VPQTVVESEKEIYRSQVVGKPPQVADKIVEGKLEKFFNETCLLEQPFIRDEKLKVKDLVIEKIAKLGENIVVKRFARFQVGERL